MIPKQLCDPRIPRSKRLPNAFYPKAMSVSLTTRNVMFRKRLGDNKRQDGDSEKDETSERLRILLPQLRFTAASINIKKIRPATFLAITLAYRLVYAF